MRGFPTHAARRHPSLVFAMLLLALPAVAGLGACSGPEATPAAADTADSASNGEAEVRAGDLVVRASAVQTSMLAADSAARYGIARDPRRVLLLVAVRRGEGADAVSIPARVTATVTDLRGATRDLPLHAQTIAGAGGRSLEDHVGTLETSLPDTLSFDVQVRGADFEPVRLHFSRDVYPR